MNSYQVTDDQCNLGGTVIQDQTPCMQLIVNMPRGTWSKPPNYIATDVRRDIAGGCARLEDRPLGSRYLATAYSHQTSKNIGVYPLKAAIRFPFH